MIFIGVLFLILAALLLVVGGLATTRRLPGNNIFGLRVEEVRKDKETWDLAHAVAGPFWMLAGLALVFGGLVCFSPAGWTWILTLVTAVVAVLTVSIGANLGARAAHLQDLHNKEEANKPPAVDLNALRNAARKSDQR